MNDEAVKIMMNLVPMGCQIWDEKFNVIDCNLSVAEMYGFSSKEEYMENFFKICIPRYQSDGQESKIKGLTSIKKALEDGECAFEMEFQLPDGTLIPTEINLVRVEDQGSYAFLVYTRDKRSQLEVEAKLKYQVDLLNAANQVASNMVNSSPETFEIDLYNSMGIMAEAVSVDRMYIWQNSLQNGELCSTQVYEWSEKAEPQQSNQYTENIPYSEGMPEMLNFIENISLNGPISNFSEGTEAHLRAQGIQSILIVPIFMNEQFWGFMGFDDCQKERIFTEAEETVLRANSLLFANALARNSLAKELQRHNEEMIYRDSILAAVNEISLRLLNSESENIETELPKSMQLLARSVNVDRIYMCKNQIVNERINCYRIFEWSENGTIFVNGDCYDYKTTVPGWEEDLSSGICINKTASEFTPKEVEHLSAEGILAILEVPIFIGGEFWGFVGFDDCKKERVFTQPEEEVLRSGSAIIVNAFLKSDMIRKLKDATTKLETSLGKIEEDARKHELVRKSLSVAQWEMTIKNGDLFHHDNSVTMSEEFLKLLEFSGESCVESLITWSERLHPEDRDRVFKALSKHICDSSGTLPFDIECRFMTKKKAYRHFHTFGSKMNDELETSLKIVGGVHDVSENIRLMESIFEHRDDLSVRLKQQELISDVSRNMVESSETEEHMKKALTKMSKYFQASSVRVFSFDCQNQTAILVYNCSGSDEMTNPGLIACNLQIFPRYLSDDVRVPLYASDGFSMEIEESFAPLLADDTLSFVAAPIYISGELWGVFNIECNNASRKWTNNEKEFATTISTNIAGIIMRDLYEKKLKLAVEEAVSASQAKGNFLATVSHEIRTPMNAIIGMTTIGKKAQTVEQKDYAFRRIGVASSHLLGVINDVLDISKIEANKLELSPIVFSIEQLLENVVDVISLRANDKEQILEVGIDPAIPKLLFGDDQRIAQIVVNLLSNAVKFTPEKGNIKLDVKLIDETDDSCCLHFSVKDSGIGLSENQKERLFQSFEQAEQSTTRKYGGTGLGLAISKRIVEMMEGNIWVESEIGKGADFTFTIKLQKSSKISLEELEDEANAAGEYDFAGRRLLVAEDVEINREILEAILEDTNITMEFAENGLQAVRMFVRESGHYDLVFMDIQMPEMDGYDATKHIRSLDVPGAKDVPIIAMTANVFSESVEKCLESGMNEHLGKPINREEVLCVLTKYLKGPLEDAKVKVHEK